LLASLTVLPGAAAADSIAFECRTLTSSGRSSFSLLPADFNGDGRADLAVSYASTDNLVVFLNTGDRRFEVHQTIEVGDVPRTIRAGDIDADGDLDLTVANGSMTNDVAVLAGDGKGSFTKTLRQKSSGESPFDAPLADIDGDGHLDLIIVNESNNPATTKLPGRVSIQRGKGDGTFSEPKNLEAGRHPAAAQIADFDGRNGPDLAVCNWMSNDVSIFLNAGGGEMQAAKQIAYGGQLPYSLYAADFNGDGKPDLAVTDIGGKAVRVLYGDGHGDFPRISTYPAGAGLRWVTGADVDGDKRLDLITANTYDNNVTILHGKRDGGFIPLPSIGVGDGPRTVMAADLDGDGLMDLMTANSRSNDVSLLFQTRGEARACDSAIRKRPPRPARP
jgi:hypothetical protein